MQKLKPPKIFAEGDRGPSYLLHNSDPGGQATFTLRAAWWVVSQVIKCHKIAIIGGLFEHPCRKRWSCREWRKLQKYRSINCTSLCI